MKTFFLSLLILIGAGGRLDAHGAGKEFAITFWADQRGAESTRMLWAENAGGGGSALWIGFRGATHRAGPLIHIYLGNEWADFDFRDDGQPHFYAVLYDGAELKVYVDALPVSQVETSGTLEATEMGEIHWESSVFYGKKVYERVLTEDEIKKLFMTKPPRLKDK